MQKRCILNPQVVVSYFISTSWGLYTIISEGKFTQPYFPKPLAKSARLVYNQLRNQRILVCPTVAQSETNNQFKNQTDYRLSPIGVEDSLSVYLRLCLLSMYVKAANTTSKSVSTSKVFIPTSFLFPERTTARLSLLL